MTAVNSFIFHGGSSAFCPAEGTLDLHQYEWTAASQKNQGSG